ncbi:MAG: hypothetical protein H6625_06650 [Bdellovibrionaceae bacterium]|nr:hypothetical protein [Pseudobdellovibrionaceae bacterium]
MNYLEHIKEHKGWVILGALLVISSISSQFYNNSDPDKTENPPEDVSTFIPKGYRLVPLPIENYKNLDQILGNYGVVDLYVKTLINSKVHTELLGSGIRALRAKNGSESIGLLVPLEQVKTLLKKDGKFYLTINNSNSSGTVFEESKIRISKSRVSFAN